MSVGVIYTDAVRGFLTDHLSEEDLDRICMAEHVGAIERDAHVSVCQTCRIRVEQARHFTDLMRLALYTSLNPGL